MKNKYVQYGCGSSAPKEWINFDISPTLLIEKVPILGTIIKLRQKNIFPSNVLFGNIVKGLPIEEETCDAVFCSHVLEHLSLQDFKIAIKNTYIILKSGGIFRFIVPDLEAAARVYLKSLDNGESFASIKFMENTFLGIEKRQRGFKGLLRYFWGNSHHLWMWDTKSLFMELENAGFTQIQKCKFNDSKDEMFKYVEDAIRFENAVAIECRK